MRGTHGLAQINCARLSGLYKYARRAILSLDLVLRPVLAGPYTRSFLQDSLATMARKDNCLTAQSR